MPPCLICDRNFANREALVQHLATSSAWHPFCETCSRRFISKEACDGHMLAKHPPMFPCNICQRTFNAQFALEDHYRGSAVHPNCVKCGKGFRDAAGREEHRKTAHPPCSRCEDKSVCEETIEEHYLLSENHPSCTPCKVGFQDEAFETRHALSAHPERCCIACQEVFESVDTIQTHYLVSSRHKTCFACDIGFQNDTDFLAHVQTLHAKLSEGSKNKDLVGSRMTTMPLQSRFAMAPRSRMFPERPDAEIAWRSMLDRNTLPPPGRAVNALWASQRNQEHIRLSPSESRREEGFNFASAQTRTGLPLGWSPARV